MNACPRACAPNDQSGVTMTEVHHAYNNVRWEPEKNGHGGPQNGNDFDDDGGANSAKLFERSRIKALAGRYITDKDDKPPSVAAGVVKPPSQHDAGLF